MVSIAAYAIHGEKCKERLRGKGASRIALAHENDCVGGYVEYGGDIFSIAIYEYKDLGVIAAKISAEASVDVCGDILFHPYGYIVYSRSYEDLCVGIASKLERLARIIKARHNIK